MCEKKRIRSERNARQDAAIQTADANANAIDVRISSFTISQDKTKSICLKLKY